MSKQPEVPASLPRSRAEALHLEGDALDQALADTYGIQKRPYSLSLDAMTAIEKLYRYEPPEVMMGYFREIVRQHGCNPQEQVTEFDAARLVTATATERARAALLVGVAIMWGYNNHG